MTAPKCNVLYSECGVFFATSTVPYTMAYIRASEHKVGWLVG